MKLKGYTGIKKCKDGEIYRFKRGVAIVPGFLISYRPVQITLAEFKRETNKM